MNDRQTKYRYDLPRPGLIGVLLLMMLTAACAGGGRSTINLMPAPAVFAGGAIDPLPKGPPPVSYDDFQMLYASDRKPFENMETRPFYRNEPGFIVRLGSARVKAGPEGSTWEEARRVSLDQNRTGNYPLQVLSVNETGVLDKSYTFFTRLPPADSLAEETTGKFAALVNHRLEASEAKEIYIYIHGFRVVFDIPLLVASELWHFLGYRGAFIAYAWPSTPNVFAYWADVETATSLARKLRLLLTYLAEETQVEKIHIVGFSAGSRLVVRALNEMALLHADASDEEIRKNVKIGNVIIIGGDINREAFGAALADGLLRVPQRITVYTSSADRALIWSRRIFRHKRLGQTFSEEVPPGTLAFLKANPSLEFIDVTDAADSTTGNGHNYFRQSPWVSSDLLALLAYDMDADERGLEKAADLPVWSFPPDYIDRLKSLLKERNSERTGMTGDRNSPSDVTE